jgi:hypothetical protein
MNDDYTRREKNRYATKELRNVDDTYVFDSTSGLYKPKSYDGKEEREPQRHTITYERPVDVRTRHDWIATIISAATLIALVIYTDYTRGIFDTSQVSAIGTIQAAWAAQKSADAAKTASNTAQAELELSERPWIKIVDVKTRGDDPIFGALSFQKIGPYKGAPDITRQATLQTSVLLKNIGHSVADVTVSTDLFMGQFSPDKYSALVAAEEKSFCESNERTNPKFTLWPDDTPFENNGAASSPIRRQSINRLPNDPRSYITISLIVCVNYRLSGFPKIYQTRTVYTVTRAGGRFFELGECDIHPVMQSPMIFCKGGLPASLLKLDRDTLADDAY